MWQQTGASAAVTDKYLSELDLLCPSLITDRKRQRSLLASCYVALQLSAQDVDEIGEFN